MAEHKNLRPTSSQAQINGGCLSGGSHSGVTRQSTGATDAGEERTIREYTPDSWFHPVGIFKVLRRLEPRLPNVSNGLFLTFTLAPIYFSNEETAYHHSRNLLRKIFYKLRKGILYNGKKYQIDAPYCIKVEFHDSGWVHYHAIFLTRRFLPKELLSKLWDLGWVKVQRINNDDFRYLLKYITKADDLPEWVKGKKRLRVFQPSKGFLTPLPQPEKKAAPTLSRPRLSYTIAERIERWKRMGVIRYRGNAWTVRFRVPFRDIFDHLVLIAALDGRYNGRGEIIIQPEKGITEWNQIEMQLLGKKP